MEYCSNCSHELTLAYAILTFLRAQEFAIFITDIYAAFPASNSKQVRRVLVELKRKELVVTLQRGYYSA